MCGTEDRQLALIEEWLEVELGESARGVFSVKERIAYLVVCNGGYASNEEAVELAGTKIGPFTIGLSPNETTEFAYFMGMLSGMELLCVSPYKLLDSYIEEYITTSFAEFGMVINASGIMQGDTLDMKRLFDSYDYLNPIHGGDDN